MIIASLIILLVIGLFDGFIELIKHHYSKFKAIFPKANDNYWNPNISWKNKWRDGIKENGEKFFLSSTALVFLTDAYHLFRMVSKISLYVMVGLLIGTNVLFWVVLVFVIHTIGFYLTWRQYGCKRKYKRICCK